MKYFEAALLGEEMGLETPAEFVRNVHLHSMNLFGYDEAWDELEELDRDAAENGVRFSLVCGDPTDSNVDEECEFCTNIRRLLGET